MASRRTERAGAGDGGVDGGGGGEPDAEQRRTGQVIGSHGGRSGVEAWGALRLAAVPRFSAVTLVARRHGPYFTRQHSPSRLGLLSSTCASSSPHRHRRSWARHERGIGVFPREQPDAPLLASIRQPLHRLHTGGKSSPQTATCITASKCPRCPPWPRGQWRLCGYRRHLAAQ